MTENLSETAPVPSPRISIIVPVRAIEPEEIRAAGRCIRSIENSKFDLAQVEVIIVEGNNPSAQRNQGARRASGEILYFLDDDSELHPRALQRIVEAFEDHPQFAGIGGPSVGSRSASLFQKCAAMAMGSLFGLGPARHRYYPSGCPRPGGDNELILSNFAIRRSVWNQNEGFDPRLYPNEENEFINRLEGRGIKFLYHPSILVFRPARENWVQLLHQIWRYGRSRSRHIQISSRPVNLLLALPATLVAYLVLIAAPALLGMFALPGPATAIALLPAVAYLALIVTASLYAGLSVRRRRLGTFLWHLVLFPTIHFGYGCGMLSGFLLPLAHPPAETEFSVALWKHT